MSIVNAIILGVVQGLTEFLPVSSSGHLVIVQNMLSGFEQPGVLFDVILHLGTSGAVVFYLRDRLLGLKSRDLGLIVIGMFPAAVVGYFFSNAIEVLFTSVKVVGVALLVTAGANFLIDRMVARRRNVGKVDAFLVGVVQAFAIIPGISRSGLTIFAGTSLGVERREAAEFSFLLSVPTILGASVVEIMKYGFDSELSLASYGVGFMAAFGSAILAIQLVMRLLSERRFRYFSVYCLVIAGLILFLI